MSAEGAAVKPSATRRERRRAATRSEIVATARGLLRAGEPISLRSVAHQLGLTAPALYRYVDSYEGLLTAVAAEIYADILRELAAAKARGGDEPARQVVLASVAFRRWALRNRAEFALLFTNLDTGPFPNAAEGGARGSDAGPTTTTSEAHYRFGAFFAEIYQALWDRYRFVVPTEADLGPDLASALGVPNPDPRSPHSAAQHLSGVPAGLAWLFTRAWARLYGTVTLEVFGHLDPALVRSGALFTAMLADNAADMHLDDELAPLRPLLHDELAH